MTARPRRAACALAAALLAAGVARAADTPTPPPAWTPVPALAQAPAPTGPVPARAGADVLLDRIVDGLARDAARERRFVERRRSALFVEPVESRGTLRFVAPATFEKLTDAPTRERLRIDAERATVQRGEGAPVVVALDAHPALRAIADALRGALAGDARALRTAFTPAVSGDDARWRIELVPRDAGAARAIERVVLAGGGGRLERIDVLERSGDATELWLVGRDGRG